MCDKNQKPEHEPPVLVLTPEDFAPTDTLEDKMKRLENNRYQIVMHNMDYIRRQRNISQKDMCEIELQGTPTSSQMSAYRTARQPIPYRTIVRMAAAYGYTPEQLTGQMLDAATQTEPISPQLATDYQKYLGQYSVAYFNPASALGENQRTMARSIAFGVLTIYRHKEDGGNGLRVAALLNAKEEVCRTLLALLEEDTETDPQRLYERATMKAMREDTNERQKCYYRGTFVLQGNMAELTLRQVYGSDVAILRFHNRAANASAGSAYKGGLAILLSNSRGREHMPCVQAAVLSRRGFSHVAREELAQYLLLQPPRVDLRAAAKDIMTYVKTLFPDEGTKDPLRQLPDEDKVYLLERYMEKKLTDAIRCNVVGYYKVSTEMDSTVYKALCR